MIEAPHNPQTEDARKDSKCTPIHHLSNFTTTRKQCDSTDIRSLYKYQLSHAVTLATTLSLLLWEEKLTVQPLTCGFSTGGEIFC